MVKNKKLNFILPLVIYPFDIMFSFGETDSELKKSFKKYNIQEGNYFTHELRMGRCSQFEDTGQIVIRLKYYPDDNHQLGVLQHEIYHAVNYLMSYIGNTFSYESEESYAYLLQYITEEVYNRLKIAP